jgi:hypothetical protein
MNTVQRTRSVFAALLAVTSSTLSGCTGDHTVPTEPRAAPSAAAADASATAGQPTAVVALTTASALVTQTGTTAWTLAKTGAVDATTKTVTWTITATKGTTTPGQLVVSGVLAVTNTGTAGATIGNIAVTLQQKSGSAWTSLSADVADATYGDAATTAHIDPKASSENLATISENSASGTLQFLDAHANTLFSLVPQQTIAPGATVTLLFSARFDNTVLHLTTGAAVRAEVIVSFGHSTANKPSAQDVDINGNGTIDADEAWVRSVPARLGLTVPQQQSDNAALTIADVASNITTTGTVTFATPTFNLGATSGTVTVHYDGGASGGKLTNCATGTGSGTTVVVGGFSFPVDGSVALQACDTQDIGATPACTAGTLGCGWASGDMITYGQGEYGSSSGAAELLLIDDYSSVYSSTGGIFIIGDKSKYYEEFDSPSAVHAYLPQVDPVGILDGTLFDPTVSASGQFGGDVAALKLNVDFSDAGVIGGSAGLKFGDLLICNVATPSGVNGMTVRQFLTAANVVLGATSSAYTASALDAVAVQVNGAFDSGNPSTFAQTHLVNGSSCGWKNGDFNTYVQSEWGGDASITTAQTLLEGNFNTVYAAAFGVLIVGGTFTMTFDSPSAIEDYLPQTGPAGSLTATHNDPTDSGSGKFGGDVVTLKLNVDFADAGLLGGTMGLKFGDLKICNSGVAAIDGSTVRQFLAGANVVLGGGTSSYGTVSDLQPIAANLNSAFLDGTPSSFAQAHLVSGTCP